MPVPTSQRSPKFKEAPPESAPKLGVDPARFDSETMAWNFHRLDRDHADWGWELKAGLWRQLLAQLISFEGLKWGELQGAAGGRRNGTNHHPIPISDLSSAATKRLAEKRLDDASAIFSLRLTNTLRVYGFRDGRVLRLVWYDPHHGTQRGVCPTSDLVKRSQKKKKK
jgi:hypothetical protein